MSAVDVQTRILAGGVIIFLLAAALGAAAGDKLPKIGPAPEFKLTNQDGKRLALKELRGKVLAVTFIYASCTDTCPLLTAKMAGLQSRLGPAFGPKVFFVSITVDAERDTPEALKGYMLQRTAQTLPAGRFSRVQQLRFVTSPGAMESTTRKCPAATWTIVS